MITGIGIDILDVRKLEHLINNRGKEFLNEIFTEKEQAYAKEHHGTPNLATAFTGKEAFVKAVGGIKRSDFSMKEIEILRMSSGQPYIELRDPLKEKFNDHFIYLSLSFTDDIASAIVILEKI